MLYALVNWEMTETGDIMPVQRYRTNYVVLTPDQMAWQNIPPVIVQI